MVVLRTSLKVLRAGAALALAFALLGCASGPYAPQPMHDPTTFSSYQSKTMDDVTVSIAILSDEDYDRVREDTGLDDEPAARSAPRAERIASLEPEPETEAGEGAPDEESTSSEDESDAGPRFPGQDLQFI